MLKLRTYKYKELKEIEAVIESGRHNIDFLIDNISALRILGYKLILPKPLKFKHAFHDVITVDENLKSNKALITKVRSYDRE